MKLNRRYSIRIGAIAFSLVMPVGLVLFAAIDAAQKSPEAHKATSVAGQGMNSSDSVQIRWDAKGVSSIRFQGHEYLAFGALNLSRAILVDSQGKPQPSSLQASVKIEPLAQTATYTFPWSAIQAKVTADQNVLNIAIAITNTSPDYIKELSLEPMRLRFDQKPAQYDGSVPILADNISKPAVLVMSTSNESVVLANEDPKKPLSIGFPWAIDKPASTEFPIRIVTGREPMYPDMTPPIDRPIAPGQTDTYKLSLTFGISNYNPDDLALSVYRKFTHLYPATLNWPDRRPIGAIVLATADAGFPNNPRGWFLDRSLNVFGPRGKTQFRSELMKWADTSISILHQLNAQGVITWDIEGEQYPHPNTYVGDPRLIDVLDPEMSSCVDEYFKRFRDAGLRVGVTIRPQQFVKSSDARTATQQPVAEPARLLSDKIKYARQRWNATLFYVDSNGDPNYPMDAEIFREVAIGNPGVLLIPEHSNLFYYGVSAPYGELRQGVVGSPSLVRRIYPGAFRVVNTSDGGIAEHSSELSKATREGDILMFRAWFRDPANDLLRPLAGFAAGASH